MTSLPREVAQRRPANLPTQPDRKVIEGTCRPADTPAMRVINTGLLILLAAFFAGFLLSIV